jgi:parvulin-like peptidyl-prolyl isomerase
MRMSRPITTLLTVAVLVAAAVSCKPEKPSTHWERERVAGDEGAAGTTELDKQPVLIVDGESISLEQFNRRVNQLAEFVRVRYASIERRQGYLDAMAQFEVLADRAEEQGYGARPEVHLALEEALADHLIERVVRQEGAEGSVDHEAVEAYYKANRETFLQPRARRVALIAADSRDYADALAERVRKDVAGSDQDPLTAFRIAAAAYSLDRSSGADGGDIGFVEAPEGEPEHAELARAVFELEEPGQITEVIPFDDGFALATFIEERPETLADIDEVSADIRQTLQEQRTARRKREFIDELREQADIETFDEVAGRAQPPEPPGLRRIEQIPVTPEPAFDRDDDAVADAPD